MTAACSVTCQHAEPLFPCSALWESFSNTHLLHVELEACALIELVDNIYQVLGCRVCPPVVGRQVLVIFVCEAQHCNMDSIGTTLAWLIINVPAAHTHRCCNMLLVEAG